jgi:hypothetical protein
MEGFRAGRLCTICSHPQREAINHALAAGTSYRNVWVLRGFQDNAAPALAGACGGGSGERSGDAGESAWDDEASIHQVGVVGGGDCRGTRVVGATRCGIELGRLAGSVRKTVLPRSARHRASLMVIIAHIWHRLTECPRNRLADRRSKGKMTESERGRGGLYGRRSCCI